MNRRRPAVTAILALALGATAGAQEILHVGIGTTPSQRFGHAVANAGDVDSDGIPDHIVSSNGGSHVDEASVYSGADFSVLHVLSDAEEGSSFGYDVSSAGDVDADGHADLLVGAPQHDRQLPLMSNVGRVTLHSGFDGAVLRTFDGFSAGDHLGWSASGAGDVDQDGVPDFVLGAPYRSGPANPIGAAYVRSGATGQVLYTYLGEVPGDRLGSAVSAAGDVNADGHADVILAAPTGWVGPLEVGRVSVRSGLDGTELHRFQGTAQDDRFGSDVAGAGDVDCDGFDDLLVGASFEDASPPGTDHGVVRVYSGRDGLVLHRFEGGADRGHLGLSVATAGDVNRDGIPDFIAGAPGELGLGDKGAAYVYLGGLGAAVHRVAQIHGFDTGAAVAGLGDLNDDGLDDFVVSSPGWKDAANGDRVGSTVIYTACGLIVPYGQGCPGSGGFVPELGARGCARQGGSLTVSLSGGPAGINVGLLLIGGDRATLGTGGGCTLLVDSIARAVPLLISGSGDGHGQTEVSGAIPPDWPVGPVTLQAVVPDPAGPKGYTLSNGIEVTVP